MDIGQLRGLLLDLECMTALRHTLKNRAVAALVALCRECARDDASEAALTAAYCRAYDAWLDAAGAAVLRAKRWKRCCLKKARRRCFARGWMFCRTA